MRREKREMEERRCGFDVLGMVLDIQKE